MIFAELRVSLASDHKSTDSAVQTRSDAFSSIYGSGKLSMSFVCFGNSIEGTTSFTGGAASDCSSVVFEVGPFTSLEREKRFRIRCGDSEVKRERF